MESLSTRAFREIQNDPGLYKIWCEAKTQRERDDMLLDQAYSLGWNDFANSEYDTEIL